MTTATIDTLKDAILSKNKDLVISELSSIKSQIENNTGDLAQLIVSPAVITELHNMLIDNLGVVRRTMQLRARVPHPHRRALLFVQAMINGVNYLP